MEKTSYSETADTIKLINSQIAELENMKKTTINLKKHLSTICSLLEKSIGEYEKEVQIILEEKKSKIIMFEDSLNNTLDNFETFIDKLKRFSEEEIKGDESVVVEAVSISFDVQEEMIISENLFKDISIFLSLDSDLEG